MSGHERSSGARPTAFEVSFVIALMALVLLVVRLGTLDLPPTWDSAMTVWPSAIEMAQRDSIMEVIALPGFSDSGPNTHTLTPVTLLTGMSIETLGIDAAITVMHLFNMALLVGLGASCYWILRTRSNVGTAESALIGFLVLLFPLLVAQSAYLYLELAAALLVLGALWMALEGRRVWLIVFLVLAVLTKPLAITCLPACLLAARRAGGSGRFLALMTAAGLGAMLPEYLSSVSGVSDASLGENLFDSWENSLFYAGEAPEVILLAAVPIAAAIATRRRAYVDPWPPVTLVLWGGFVAFFALNGIVGEGYGFVPRYATMLVAPSLLCLPGLISGLKVPTRTVILSAGIVIALLATRGPLALGDDTSLHPTAERSLAFAELFEEHKRGLNRLAEMSADMTVYYDKYAYYGVSYPQMGHISGEILNGEAVLSVSFVDTYDSLPTSYAMLVEFPHLGSGVLRRIGEIATNDSAKTVSTESMGRQIFFPVEIIQVTSAD